MAGISPTMIIAADGITSGQGLSVSPALTDALNSFNSSELVTLYSDVQNALIAGNVAMPTVPSWLNGKTAPDSTTSITAVVSSAASAIAPDTKKYISNINAAASFAQTSFQWSGPLQDLGSKSFSDMGLGITKVSEMVSGGMGSIMSAGSTVAGVGASVAGIASAAGNSIIAGVNSSPPDFSKLALTMKNFGSAFNPSDLQKMFDPASFVKNLQKNGLRDIGSLNDKLIAANLDPDNLDSANPDVIKEVLKTITGLDVATIISQTKMVLPAGTSVETAADLLDAKKVMSEKDRANIPGGSLDGLGNALSNMGGNFPSVAALSASLAAVTIPALPNLDALTNPIPTGVFDSLKAKLGSGIGPFGNPTLVDIIGTASGYIHTDAFIKLYASHLAILETTEGKALKSAANALILDATNVDTLAAFVAAQANVVTPGNPDLLAIVNDCKKAVDDSAAQLANESSNQTKAGLVVSAATTPTTAQLMAFANKLPDFGVDKQEVGYNYILLHSTTQDQYGEAILASLIEGKNSARSSASGIVSSVKSSASDLLAKAKSALS